MSSARKISVVGNSGSGKSTAARQIAREMGLAHLELDSLRHQPDWQELPDAQFARRVEDFMSAHPGWVIDGNYSVIQPLVWDRATDVLWMNPPKLENMINIIWRTLRRAILREELWNGNRERWQNLLSLDPYKSMIAWAWTRYDTYVERYEGAMRDPRWSQLRFHRLRSRQQLERWIDAQTRASSNATSSNVDDRQ